jgi:hypothetical protein
MRFKSTAFAARGGGNHRTARDPDLAEVIHAPDFVPEPDFIDSILPDWFDVTPRRQWVAHLLRYGETHGNQPDQAHLLPTDRR